MNELNNEVSIDYYVNNKNTIQEYLNKLEQSDLINIFSMITAEIPNVQYSKNKNGYFIDIKQLPSSLIDKIDSACQELLKTE